MSVERLILAAVRRECARQRIWSKPSSQRLTVQAVGGIIHHPEAGLWFFYAHAAMAAALGQLGQHEAAQKAVRDLLALRPDFAATVRPEYGKWYSPEEVEHLIDGLRKAGLEIPESG